MSKSLNQCSFTGRLGRDPEYRTFDSGAGVTKFSIAVSNTFTNKSGEKQETTEWVDVEAFGKLSEICRDYLNKGSMVYLSGEYKTDKWQNEAGENRSKVKIIAREMIMLDSKGNKESDSSSFAEEMPF